MTNYTFPLALLLGVFVSAIGIWWHTKRDIKEKTSIKQNIPEEVDNDFNEAERRFKESYGEENPNAILWDIAQKGRTKRRINSGTKTDNSTLPTEPGVTESSDDRELEGRQDIPIGNANSDDTADGSNKQSNKNYKRNIFSRFIGRK